MQSGSYKDLEICRGDQGRHIVEGGLQRSETKQGTVTEKKKDIKVQEQKERKLASTLYTLRMTSGGGV